MSLLLYRFCCNGIWAYYKRVGKPVQDSWSRTIPMPLIFDHVAFLLKHFLFSFLLFAQQLGANLSFIIHKKNLVQFYIHYLAFLLRIPACAQDLKN